MRPTNNRFKKVEDVFADDRDYPTGNRSAAPVTPKILVKALKSLKQGKLKGLFFNARDVTWEILRLYPQVEQDFLILYFEVSDKLSCAAAAGIVGIKHDRTGYYAFNSRQESNALDYRSELMFWVFYKRLLSKRVTELKYLLEQQKKEKALKKDPDETPKKEQNKFSANTSK